MKSIKRELNPKQNSPVSHKSQPYSYAKTSRISAVSWYMGASSGYSGGTTEIDQGTSFYAGQLPGYRICNNSWFSDAGNFGGQIKSRFMA